MKSHNSFGYDKSKLIPLYLCSDGCYRRADQISQSKSTAVGMDAKAVATDNGLSDKDYQLIRQAIRSVQRPAARRRKPVARDAYGNVASQEDINQLYARLREQKRNEPVYVYEQD